MALRHQGVEFFDHIGGCGGVKVAVGSQRRFDVVMAEALADEQDGVIQIYQKGGVRVSQIVQPYRLHPGSRAPGLHLLSEVVFRVGEQAIIRVRLIQRVDVRSDLVA